VADRDEDIAELLALAEQPLLTEEDFEEMLRWGRPEAK
jgi:hypothetical protein